MKQDFFPGLSQFNLKPGSTHSIGDYDKMLNILRKSKNPIGFQLRDASTLKRLHETVPYKGGESIRMLYNNRKLKK